MAGTGSEKARLDLVIQELKDPTDSQKRSEEKSAARPLDLLCPSVEVLETAARDGRRLLFSAPENVDLHQMEGYEVVQSKTGGPVKSREMVLMSVPEDIARLEESRIADATKAQTENIEERMMQVRDEVEHAMRRAGYSQRQVEEQRRISEINIERGGE